MQVFDISKVPPRRSYRGGGLEKLQRAQVDAAMAEIAASYGPPYGKWLVDRPHETEWRVFGEHGWYAYRLVLHFALRERWIGQQHRVSDKFTVAALARTFG